MSAEPHWLWDVLVPVGQWGAAVLVCVGLALWLSAVLRRMDEESTPGRRACPNCGYDVRATPELCPECGRVLPPPEAEVAEEVSGEPVDTDAAPATTAQVGWGTPPTPSDSDSTGSAMPIYTIPPDAGPFTVVEAPDKSYAVTEVRAVDDAASAAKLGFLFISCRDRAQAQDVCARLNRGEHDGTIQVDLLSLPTVPEQTEER